MAAEAIYEHPADYDLELAAHAVEDLPFWCHLLLRERPVRVLEIGAGTGRLTVPLARLGAESGFSVTGLEPERAMLAQAEARWRQDGVGLGTAPQFVLGDVRSLCLPERYDLVLLPYGAAHHLLTLDEQLAAWRNVRRHLTRRGLFCIDVCAPDYRMLADAITGTPRHQDLEARGGDGRHLRRTVASRYAPATQLLTHAYQYQVTDPDGAERRYRSDFAMHVYFPGQMELLCRQTGFAVEQVLGSYTGGPFDDHARVLIMLARACEE